MRKLLLGLVLTAMPAMAQQAPDVEHNKAVVREFFTDVLDGGQLQHYTDSHAPNFVAHSNRDYSLAEDKAIAKAVWALLSDAERRREMHSAGLMTIDGNASARIASDLAGALAARRAVNEKRTAT